MSRGRGSTNQTISPVKQKQVRLRSDLTVGSEFAFSPVGHCFLYCNQFISAVMWSLRFPFFRSCVCHAKRFTTLRTRPVNMFLDARPFAWVCVSVQKTHQTKRRTLQYVCRRVYIFKSKAQNKFFVILKKVLWLWSNRRAVRVVLKRFYYTFKKTRNDSND